MKKILLVGLLSCFVGELCADEAEHQKREARHVPAGYSFVWADSFDGAMLDEANWFVGMRDPLTGDTIAGADGDYLLNKKYAGYVTEEDSFVLDGSLILRNQKRSYVGDSPAGLFEYTSGWVMSMHRVHFNKGYMEVRAKFPRGDKVWPAIWLVAEDLIWGPEWDLWEYFGDREGVGSDIMGMHLMTGLWGKVKWNSDWLVGFDAQYDSEAWHIFGWEWTNDTATWWIDGKMVRTLHRDDTKKPSDWPDESMYIVLNNGVRTLSPDKTTDWPNDLEIDYIEVYQREPALIY
jgi:beta-glucanase (GH16 family)